MRERNADPYTIRPPEGSSAEEGWLTVKEAAEVLDVSETTVRNRIARNELKARRNDEDVLEVLVTPGSAGKR